VKRRPPQSALTRSTEGRSIARSVTPPHAGQAGGRSSARSKSMAESHHALLCLPGLPQIIRFNQVWSRYKIAPVLAFQSRTSVFFDSICGGAGAFLSECMCVHEEAKLFAEPRQRRSRTIMSDLEDHQRTLSTLVISSMP
jgi:hypothetical protein